MRLHGFLLRYTRFLISRHAGQTIVISTYHVYKRYKPKTRSHAYAITISNAPPLSVRKNMQCAIFGFPSAGQSTAKVQGVERRENVFRALRKCSLTSAPLSCQIHLSFGVIRFGGCELDFSSRKHVRELEREKEREYADKHKTVSLRVCVNMCGKCVAEGNANRISHVVSCWLLASSTAAAGRWAPQSQNE